MLIRELHGGLAIIIYARHFFSCSRVLAEAASVASASNLLRAITHGSVPEISRSPPRFAFNFVPGLRPALVRLSLERVIFILLNARAPGIATCKRKKKKRERMGKREKSEEKFKRMWDLFVSILSPYFIVQHVQIRVFVIRTLLRKLG